MPAKRATMKQQRKKLIKTKPSASKFKVGHVMTYNKKTYVVKTRAQPTGKRTKYWQAKTTRKPLRMLKPKRAKLRGGGERDVVTVLSVLANPASIRMKDYATKLQDGIIHAETFQQVQQVAAEMLDMYKKDIDKKGPVKAYERLVETCNSREYIVQDPDFVRTAYARAQFIVMTHIAWYALDEDRPNIFKQGKLHFIYAPKDNIFDTFQAHTPNLLGAVVIGSLTAKFGQSITFEDADTNNVFKFEIA